MKQSTHNINTPAHAKQKLIRASDFQLVHWIIILLSLMLTVGAWLYSKDQIHQKIQAKFDRNADYLVDLVKERMSVYENALWGGVALIDTNNSAMTYEQWKDYSKSLDIHETYPGINGIGVIYNIQQDQMESYLAKERLSRPDYNLHPSHTESEFWPITYIEPSAPNQRAVGLDMAFEKNRYSAVKKARDTGTTQLTGPITLVQDAKKTPGFLLYAPFYKNGTRPQTIEERQDNILGVTYAPFIMFKLMQGTLALENRHIDIRITDSGELLFEDDKNRSEYDPEPLFKKNLSIEIYGRIWKFDMQSDKAFRAESSNNQPIWILIFGAIIDVLIICTFIFFIRANRKALEYSDKTTHELQRKTQYLEKSNQRIAIATRAGRIGIWEYNLADNSLIWDDRMYRLYGIAPEDFSGAYEAWEKGVHPEDITRSSQLLQDAIDGGKEFDTLFRVVHPSGDIRWIKANAEVIFDANGTADFMIGTNIDVTEQHLLEEKLIQSVKEAEAANSAKSDFLANMSHEIRTPMNGVLGMAELMRGTELNTRQQEYIGMIESSAKSLLLLLNDILDLSKIESGQLSLDPIPTNLDESVGDIMKGFAVTAHKKGLDLHYYIHPKVPEYISIDRLRLGQVMFNLVGNAVKFTHEGQVLVEISSTASTNDDETAPFTLKICVRDTGIGIPMDKQADIFNPFQQADSSVTRQFGGSGLGLPIVVNLVKLMGGEISLSSEPGTGTQIELSLPVVRCHKAEIAFNFPKLSSSLDFTNLRILAVDDNLINQRWLKDMAQSWGSRIDIASSAKEGLAVLEAAEQDNDPVSILITDKNMPELSGFDLVSMIKEAPIKRPSIIIMLTSSEVENDIKTAANLGIEEFILKPVKQSEVFNAIQSALSFNQNNRYFNPSFENNRAQKSLTILVAEDNLVNQRVIHDILEPRGHTITIVENGALAVSQVENNFYDIILMDVQMPVMGGFEATQIIRKFQTSTGKRSHIIGVTAHALKGDKELGLKAGMDGYLTKPVFAKNLIQTVEQSIYDNEVQLHSLGSSLDAKQFFDKNNALQVTGNSQSLLSKMAQMTLEHLPDMLKDVDACIEAESETDMQVHLHKLTGMVANLCSPDLVDQLKFLESNLNEILSPQNAQYWAKLRTNIMQFQEELKIYTEDV